LEAYWKGGEGVQGLMRVFWETAEAGWRAQLDAGIEHIGVGDATLYDLMLDWAVRFGLIPAR